MTPATLIRRTSCRDWRLAAAGDVVPLVQAEVRAWRETLSWDVADAWCVIEPARQTGQLPGLLACDDRGRAVGWTAYLPHHRHLQVMAFVAGDEDAAAVLLDGLLASAEARACDSTRFCVREASPHLARVLAARGFVVDRYRYLMRDLHGSNVDGIDLHARPGPDRPVRPHASFDRWQADDDAMAALCEVAYRDAPGVRAFAPGGTMSEWRQYVSTLVQGTGCGRFLPDLSAVVPTPSPVRSSAGASDALDAHRSAGASARRLDACLMLTDLGTGVAHIAQVAVDPSARGRGLARHLVQRAMIDASARCEAMSLLVSPRNVAAVRLYESLGFRDHASFIVASRPAGDRLRSARLRTDV